MTVPVTEGFQDVIGQAARKILSRLPLLQKVGPAGLPRHLPTWAGLCFCNTVSDNVLQVSTVRGRDAERAASQSRGPTPALLPHHPSQTNPCTITIELLSPLEFHFSTVKATGLNLQEKLRFWNTITWQFCGNYHGKLP